MPGLFGTKILTLHFNSPEIILSFSDNMVVSETFENINFLKNDIII